MTKVTGTPSLTLSVVQAPKQVDNVDVVAPPCATNCHWTGDGHRGVVPTQVCTGCHGTAPDTSSLAGSPWHAACLKLHQELPGHYRIPADYPRADTPLTRPLSDIDFVRRLTPDERRKPNIRNIVLTALRSAVRPDIAHYEQLLKELQARLPPWRGRTQPWETMRTDPYTLPILERMAPLGKGVRAKLRVVIAQRKQREGAAAQQRKRENQIEECRMKYGPRINQIAARWREEHQHCQPTLATARLISRQVLGVARVEVVLPGIVRAEVTRQADIARQRASSRARGGEPLPMLARWPTLKIERTEKRVRECLTTSTYYHSSRSSFDAHHEISISFGPTVTAEGKTTFGGYQKYGRQGWRKTHVDWHTSLVLPSDWWTQMARLGSHLVEGYLVLGVGDPLPAKKGHQAVAASILVQNVGAKVSVREVALIRAIGGAWAVAPIPTMTALDHLLETMPTVRKPPRRRQQFVH